MPPVTACPHHCPHHAVIVGIGNSVFVTNRMVVYARYIPTEVSLDLELSGVLLVIDIIVDIFNVAWIPLTCHTAVRDRGAMIKNVSILRRRQLPSTRPIHSTSCFGFGLRLLGCFGFGHSGWVAVAHSNSYSPILKSHRCTTIHNAAIPGSAHSLTAFQRGLKAWGYSGFGLGQVHDVDVVCCRSSRCTANRQDRFCWRRPRYCSHRLHRSQVGDISRMAGMANGHWVPPWFDVNLYNTTISINRLSKIIRPLVAITNMP